MRGPGWPFSVPAASMSRTRTLRGSVQPSGADMLNKQRIEAVDYEISLIDAELKALPMSCAYYRCVIDEFLDWRLEQMSKRKMLETGVVPNG